MTTPNAESAPRFLVRQRSDGFAVVDAHGLQLERRYDQRTTAESMAKSLNADEHARTYGITWYVEVDAINEQEAVRKARQYLAPAFRKDWEPLTVDLFDPDGPGPSENTEDQCCECGDEL